MDKRLMVVGGTVYQIPLIKKAQEMGIKVINIDGNKNAPGLKVADESVVIDILNYKEVIKIAFEKSIHGIVTDQSDIALRTVCNVGQSLNLPSISFEEIDLFTNKFKMREFLRKNGFCYPRYALCNNLEEVYEFAEKVGYPFIIKPLDSRGSAGVAPIFSQNDIEKKYNVALISNIDIKNKVLVEEYITGDYYVLDGIMVNGKHHTLAIGKKEQYTDNDMVTQNILYSKDDYTKLEEINNLLIEKTGLQFANTHVEFKIEQGKMHLIEFAARGGGGHISSKIVPAVSKVDTQKIIIQNALGMEIDEADLDRYRYEKYVLLHFLDSREGIIKEIKGSKEIELLEGVLDFYLNIAEGSHVENMSNTTNRIGGYMICADTNKELENIKSCINNTLQITYY